MAEESVQKWLGRNRPPRVQITYDLETRGAIEKKELPLVVGIIAPLYGDTEQDAKSYREGKFIEIDVDNFDEVMGKIAPTFKIPGSTEVLTFGSVDDFTPDSIVQSPYLKEKLEQRQYLTDLLGRADGNDQLCKDLLAIYTDQNNKGNLIAALKKVPPMTGTLAVKDGKFTVTPDSGDAMPVTVDQAKVSGERTDKNALATGDKVTVKGSVDGGLTTITATEIVVVKIAGPTSEGVDGTLTVDNGALSLTPAKGGSAMTVTPASNMAVTGQGRTKDTLATGDNVTVKGAVSGLTITATEIAVKTVAAAPPAEKSVTGTLTKAADKITVTPKEGPPVANIIVAPTTPVTGKKTAFADLQGGETVKVTYTEAQGVLTAKTIEVS
ncbi:MAG TPA: type VI secretion system contractile sheath small subunit [Thermoanaerobaculia bacterium]|nr:type VI secretion system contractile sheath small subunit [Thermoanaerobaculia bacterium]